MSGLCFIANRFLSKQQAWARFQEPVLRAMGIAAFAVSFSSLKLGTKGHTN